MATKKPIYVDELFGTLEPTLPNDGYKWFVIRTKPQREKKLATWAKQNSIEYYLPQYTSTKSYQYRKVEFTKPLFPGYLFAKMTANERDVLFRAGHIVTTVRIPNEEFLVKELQRINNIKQSGVSVQPHELITRGTKVQVTSGALKGNMGFVLESKNGKKLIITLNFLGQSIEASLYHDQIEIITEE